MATSQASSDLLHLRSLYDHSLERMLVECGYRAGDVVEIMLTRNMNAIEEKD